MNKLEMFLQVSAALAVVLLVAHACGVLIQRIGQPKVVGEMVAGILLGPSALGYFMPSVQAEIFTPEVKNALYVLSSLGLSAYMFLVGCELDIKEFRGAALRRAGTLSVTGIVPSLILGGGCGYYFYDLLSAGAIGIWQFSFYLGAALSITAFPMLARILEERNMASSKLGSLSLLAASIDDALAWCFLALIVAFTKDGPLTAGLTPLLGAAAFCAACFFVVRPLVSRIARVVDERGELSAEHFAFVLVLLLSAIWVTDRIGIYSVFGGFILGASMPKSPKFIGALRQNMYLFVVVFLLPTFFTNSGLNTNILGLVSPQLLLPFVAIILISFVSKYVFCTLAMKGIGFSWREASAIGGLFNARGLMLLMFANIGMVHGLINSSVFSMLVMVAVITTAGAMPLFTRSLGLSSRSYGEAEVFPMPVVVGTTNN